MVYQYNLVDKSETKKNETNQNLHNSMLLDENTLIVCLYSPGQVKKYDLRDLSISTQIFKGLSCSNIRLSPCKRFFVVGHRGHANQSIFDACSCSLLVSLTPLASDGAHIPVQMRLNSEFAFWRDSSMGWRVASLLTGKHTDTINGSLVDVSSEDLEKVIIDSDKPFCNKTAFGLLRIKQGR
jgi:hypothetical protein